MGNVAADIELSPPEEETARNKLTWEAPNSLIRWINDEPESEIISCIR